MAIRRRERTHPARGGGREGGGERRRLAANATVLAGAAVALVVAANVLCGKLLGRLPGLRLDLTEVHLHTLEGPTLAILEGLDREVRITGIFKTFVPPGAPPAHREAAARLQHKVFRRILDLLEEYRLRSPWIRLDLVDADADPRRGQAVAEELEIEPGRPDQATRLVVRCADRRNDLPLADLATIRTADPRTGSRTRPTLVSFRAEEAISTAILSVSRKDAPRAYFLLGHGERELGDETSKQGLGEAARLLRRRGLDPRPLNLGARGLVPGDASVLVLAGPRRDVDPSEVGAIRRFLEDGGRALFLLEPGLPLAGIASLLGDFDLELAAPDLVAVDREQRKVAGQPWDLALLQGIARTHPVTAPLAGLGLRIQLPGALPIARAGRNPSLTPVPLLQTLGAPGETKRSFAMRMRDGERPRLFDPATDRPGPLVLAWAVARPGPFGRESRIVAVGDSGFASNGWISRGGNREFLLNALEWLVGSPQGPAIPPVVDLDRTLTLTRAQDRTFVCLFLVALPAALLAMGGGVWIVRRR